MGGTPVTNEAASSVAPQTLLLWALPGNVVGDREGLRILVSELAVGRPTAMRVLHGCEASLALTREDDEEFDRYLEALRGQPDADIKLSWSSEHDFLDALTHADHVLRVAPRTRLGIPAVLTIDGEWIRWARSADRLRWARMLVGAGQVARTQGR